MFEMNFIDLLNKRFGKLITMKLIKNNDTTRYHKYKYLCKCDCGNEIFISKVNLVSGSTKSCGCLEQSNGSYKIEKYLKENNIGYKKEYKFDDCRNIKKLPFDFAILNNNDELLKIVEFDGHGHYKPARFNGMSLEEAEKAFEKTKNNDQIKNNYCKDNKIFLYRIPYWETDNTEKILDSIINITNDIHLNFAI